MIRSTVIKQTAVTKDDLKAISEYALHPLDEKEIFTFKVMLCDNDIDRDGEQFTNEALDTLAELFLGVTGIFDHNPKGKNQMARIYHTEVEEVPERKNTLGEPYRRLKAKAYMVRTMQNQDLILEILGGIKKEVSVGCQVRKKTCSICGADQLSSSCIHQKGEVYSVAGEEKLCFHRLEEPLDAYEWSFVAVPAQVNAGVVKGFHKEEEEVMEGGISTLEKAAGASKGIWLSEEECIHLKKEMGALKRRAQAGDLYRVELTGEVIKYAALAQELSPDLMQSICKKLAVEELKELKGAFEKAAQQKYPLTPQLMPKQPVSTEETSRFRI